MLESMIEQPAPDARRGLRRRERVFDGTDAVMLSAETARGHIRSRPAVEMMATIALRAEQSEFLGGPCISGRDRSIAHAVALAACRTASEVDARAILCFTETRGRQRCCSRSSCAASHNLAVAKNMDACRRATLYAGVTGTTLAMPLDTDRMIANAKARLARLGRLRRGDRVVIVAGSSRLRGATNLMKVDTI